MQDPLSGTKAAADFISELMTARADETTEVEKADDAGAPSVDSLHPDSQKAYQLCISGFADSGVDEGTQQKICSIAARDYDRRNPNGSAIGSSAGESDAGAEVEKTISTAGMSADLGSPSAEVALTDTGKRKKRLGYTA